MTCPECVHVQAEIVLYWSLYLSTLTTTISALQTNRDNKLVLISVLRVPIKMEGARSHDVTNSRQ